MAVVKMNFLSKMLGFQTNITVCLPSFSFADAYNGRPDVYVPGMKYQVLYLLHGGSGDDSDYVKFTNIVRYADDHKLAVVMPADYNAARKLTRAAAEFDGPVYLRFTRDAVPEIYGSEQEFAIGKAVQLREGSDAAIIAIGDTVRLAIEAADALSEQGVNVRVLDMHTLKPLDTESVVKALNETGKIVTVEDHNVINGLGYAVSAVAADMGRGIVKRIGIQDQFGMSAPYERLLAMNGITTGNIVATVKGIL